MKRLICWVKGFHVWGPITGSVDCDYGKVVLSQMCGHCGKSRFLWAYGTSNDHGWDIQGCFTPHHKRSWIRLFESEATTW